MVTYTSDKAPISLSELRAFILSAGYLIDDNYAITGQDGDHPIVVAFEEEPLSALFSRVRQTGGFANVFVAGSGRIRAVSFMRAESALYEQAARTSSPPRIFPSTTVGDFLKELANRDCGVLVSTTVGQKAIRDPSPTRSRLLRVLRRSFENLP